MARRSLLIFIAAVSFVLAGIASPAHAETGGYPYWNYSGPGTDPSQYVWTDSSGSMYSGYGYAYRNCADFVAWKLNATNDFHDASGYGHAYQWGANADARGYDVTMTPKVGSVAWWNSGSGMGQFGHVAWVEAVNGDQVTIQEYNNPAGDGAYNRRTISRTSVSGYIHFKDIVEEDEPVTRNAPRAVDFNGNGKDDILWYGPGAGHDALWYGSSNRPAFNGESVTVGGADTYTPIEGDFDGDGHGDIFWYGPGSNTDRLWYGTGTAGEFDGEIITVSGTYIPVVGDFNGNGKDDILWYGPGDDHDALWYGSSNRAAMFNTSVSITVGGADTYTPVSGDFDGDGYGDILWYGPGSNTDRLWYGSSTAGAFNGEVITVGGTYVPIVEDFNGNGKDDILWYGPGDDHDALWYGSSNRPAFNGEDVEVTGRYKPVSGDFDGDGYGDILWYGPGDGTDRLWYGTSTASTFDKYVISVGGTYIPV